MWRIYGTLIVLALLGPAAVLADVAAPIEIDNGVVKARFTQSDGGVIQQFFARTEYGWQLIASSFRPPQTFPSEGNHFFDPAISAQRYAVNDVLSSVDPAVEESGARIVRLTGMLRDAVIEQTVTLKPGQRQFHIVVVAKLPATPASPAKLDYLLSTFAFELDHAPQFVHTPTLKYDDPRAGPGRDQVIGDRCFHAPAVILQDAGRFCAIVPDLNVINSARIVSPDARRRMNVARNQFSVPVEADKYTMPTALDLNVISGLSAKPLASFGVMDYVVSHHMRYQRYNDISMVRTLEKPVVRYAFDLMIGGEVAEGQGFQAVTRRQWEIFGHPVFLDRPHLAMPFESYVQLVCDTTLKPLGAVQPQVPGFPDTGSFLGFTLAGQPVGGYRNAAPFMTDNLSNSEFWNNVRDASGMFLWGKRTQNPALLEMARRTINLALLAPQDSRGMFPLNYRAASGKWVRNMFSASSGHNTNLFTHINEEGDTYNIVAMSKTAAHLLQYYQRCEQDPRILAYVRRYADGLIPLVGESGSAPSYVAAKNGEPYTPLARSAQCGSSLWFLAELYSVTHDPRDLAPARRIAGYLMRSVIPRQRWQDLEQHYSCGNKPLSFDGDTEQAQPARGNLSTLWAAEGFAALYRATGEKPYLDAGEQCVDYLTFSQCCWEPHFIYTAFAFGGFTADNADTATFLDARQAEAVAPFAWYGQTLGRQDLIERAVAAARSSVVLLNLPRHQGENNIYRHTNLYPLGLGPENIDHEGHPQSAMRTSPSWGEGSGVFTGLAEASRLLGGVYVDAAHHIAVGVDGLRVDGFKMSGSTLKLTITSQLSRLPQPWDQPFATELRILSLPPGDYQLQINGGEPIKATAAQLAHFPIMITGDGEVGSGPRIH